MADKDVKAVANDLKNAGVQGPLALEQQRRNEVDLSGSSFGLGINYNRKLDDKGKLSAGVGAHTGGRFDGPVGTARLDYRPLQGSLDTGTALGSFKGEFGVAAAVAASPNAVAPMGLVTSRVTHLQSGVNAALDVGVAGIFDNKNPNSHLPYEGATGVAIFSIGKSF